MLIFSQIYFQENCTCNACEKPGKKVSNTHRYSARDSLSLSLLLLLLLCALVKVDWILLVSIFVLDTLSGRAVCSAARSALCWEHKKHCEIAWVAMAEKEREEWERERRRQRGCCIGGLARLLFACIVLVFFTLHLLLHFTCCSRLSLSLEMEIANWKIPSI